MYEMVKRENNPMTISHHCVGAEPFPVPPPIQLRLFLRRVVRLFTVCMRCGCSSSARLIVSTADARFDCGVPGTLPPFENELLRRAAKDMVEFRGVPNNELRFRPVFAVSWVRSTQSNAPMTNFIYVNLNNRKENLIK